MVNYVSFRAIPCGQCGHEFLLDPNNEPECGLGHECDLWAFVRANLKTLNERDFYREISEVELPVKELIAKGKPGRTDQAFRR